MAHIEILSESEPPRAIQLSESPAEPTTIGRDETNRVVLRGALISRHHVSIGRDLTGWYVEDLQSTNGTTLNSVRISGQHALASGDVIGLGATKISFATESRNDGDVLCVVDSASIAELVTNATQRNAGDRLRLFLEIAAMLDSFDTPARLLTGAGLVLVHCFQPSCALILVGNERWTYFHDRPDHQPGDPVDASPSVLNRVQERREALLVSDVSSAPVVSGNSSTPSVKIASAICSPIALKGQHAGLIYADRRRANNAFDNEDLRYLVGMTRLVGAAFANSNALNMLAAENKMLRAVHGEVGKLVGESPAFAALREQIATRIAPVNSTVLLLGETGTGKSLVAEAIHLASPRCRGPFVPVNCAAIPKELIESELFGYEKGAFSGAVRSKPGRFELAVGGTILLDEIGELDLAVQAKLLTVLQERRLMRVGGTRQVDVDVRVIAATNRELREEVEKSRFRADLFYRLNVLTLRIPPLRERREDIQPLCQHFLSKLGQTVGRRVAGITPEAMRLLCDYPWPGNTRELANCLERAVIFGDSGAAIDVDHLPPEIADTISPDVHGVLADKERELVQNALIRAKGNKREAARILGWYHQKLYGRLKRYGLG